VWSDLAVSGSWDESVRDSVQAALSAFASGSVPPVDGRAGYETIRVIEAAYEAAQSGSCVEL
jgi:predicted dehydrogenase